MYRFSFSATDRDIAVDYATTLKHPYVLEEQFYLIDVKGIDTYQEQELFYCWIRGVPYTLNEMIFFAVNNKLLLNIYAEGETVPTIQYGYSA